MSRNRIASGSVALVNFHVPSPVGIPATNLGCHLTYWSQARFNAVTFMKLVIFLATSNLSADSGMPLYTAEIKFLLTPLTVFT